MKSSEQILGVFYRLLLDKGVDTLLSGGKIVRGEYQFTDQKEGIEINILDNRSGYLQRGTLNLNLFMLRNADGRFNTQKMETLSSQITLLLESETFEDCHFEIEQESGSIPEPTQDDMFYKNFRFNFQTIR